MCEFGTDKETCPNCPETCQGQKGRDYKKDLEEQIKKRLPDLNYYDDEELTFPFNWMTDEQAEETEEWATLLLERAADHAVGLIEDSGLLERLHQCREREARYREALEKAYEILKIHGKYETALWCKMARATQEEVQDALSSPSQPSKYDKMLAVCEAARKLVYYRSINKELDDALTALDAEEAPAHD